MADLPWSQQVIKAHFDSSFLAQISPEQINSGLPQGLARSGASLPPSGAPLIGLLSEDPARHPDSLVAAAATSWWCSSRSTAPG